MKFSYIIAFLLISLVSTGAFAEDAASDSPSPQEQKLLKDCNLAARNSLINGDVAKVEKTCIQAIKEMEKSHPGREYTINPMLNLAFTYSLAGDYARAEPLLARAKELGEKLYKPGSRELKSINDFIEDHQKRKENPPQFNNSGTHSPH